MTATPRDCLSDELHRLSNFIECRLSQLITELLAEGRTEAVSSLAWSGCRFVESLRTIRDGKEANDE
jgi:hypothetical protein